MKKTGAVLVAAGLSSRMKTFKPLLPFGNSTISCHLVTMLKKMGLDPMIVITGYRAEELEAHLFLTGVRFQKNERYETTQMFESVKIGIEEIAEKCDRILIMPMDIPAITPETFHQVLQTEGKVVRTMYQGKTGHPIVLESAFARTLLSYEGENGLKGAIEHSGVSITNLVVDDEAVRKDVDTPEEYQELLDWNYSRGKGYPIRTETIAYLVAHEKFFGPVIAGLLEKIEQTGSIQSACSDASLSYSKGCQLIKSAEKQLGFSVVKRWTGGAGGGGAQLTEEGIHLLRNYQKMLRHIQMEADKAYWKYIGSEFFN